MPSQIAIRNDADQSAALVDDACVTGEPIGTGHGGQDHFAHQRIGRDERQFLARVHDVADTNELAPQRATRVEFTVLVGGEAAPFHQRHGERIAEHKHHRRGRRGRQTHRAGLLRLRQDQRHIAGLNQGGVRAARGDANKRNPDTSRISDEVGEFGRFAAVGQQHQRIGARDHAQVAVACFSGMDEVRGRPGRCQRGCDFARDVTAFSHAADDDAPFDLQHCVDGAREIAVQRLAQRGQRITSVIQDPTRGGEVAVGGGFYRFHPGGSH